jgi:hypothetical protein
MSAWLLIGYFVILPPRDRAPLRSSSYFSFSTHGRIVTDLASFDMPEESKRKHEENLELEDLTAGFLCNLIRRTTGQSVGEFITDMVQKENLTLEDLDGAGDE